MLLLTIRQHHHSLMMDLRSLVGGPFKHAYVILASISRRLLFFCVGTHICKHCGLLTVLRCYCVPAEHTDVNAAAAFDSWLRCYLPNFDLLESVCYTICVAGEAAVQSMILTLHSVEGRCTKQIHAIPLQLRYSYCRLNQ